MADSRELQILLSLKDEASKKLEKASGSLGDLGSIAKKASIAFTAVAGAVVAFGTMAVKAAAEAEVEMARFDATLKTMGNTAIANRDKILAAADAATKLGFDDEDAANSIVKLYQRTGDLTEAMNLNQIAMDLSRSKNMELTDASNMVGMVLSGNSKILKQYGIDIKDSATPQQALIELQAKLAGQAQAYSNTLIGSTDRMKVAWSNLLETLGGSEGQTSVLASAINRLSDALDWLRQKIEAAGGVIPLLQGQFTAFFDWLDQHTGIITVFQQAWDNIVLMYQTRLQPQLAALWEQLKPLQPFLELLAKIIGTILLGAIIAFVKLVEVSLIVTIEILTKALEWVNGVIKNFKEGWDAVTDAIAKVITWIDTLIQKIKSLNILQGAKSAISSALGFGGGKAEGGPVKAGTGYVVGENGPEYFVPGSSGSIIPNNQLVGAGGGGNIVVNVYGDISGKDLIDKVSEGIMSKLRINGRLSV